MGIVGAKLGLVRNAFAKEFGNANTKWSVRGSVILALRDETGRVGLGEAAPLPGYSKETLADCVEALTNLLPIPFREPPAIFSRSQAPDDVSGWTTRLQKMPSAARFAVETALLDLVAQRDSTTVAHLLRPSPRTSVERCGLIDAEPSQWGSAAGALLGRGIRVLKIKVGRYQRWDEELENLQRLRDGIPESARLRLDANGSWSVLDAQSHLRSVARLKIEFVEQPTAPGDVAKLGQCDVPWAADESLRNPAEPAWLRAAGCSVFVLKPAVLGLTMSLAIAQEAHKSGIRCVASHLFDGPIALAACGALALALPGEALACGVDEHPALLQWQRRLLPLLRREGMISEREGAVGLGFSQVEREEILSKMQWTVDKWIH